jgi:hypothetical protein
LSIATRIDRYLARLIFVPLVATLTLAAMLLLLEKMLRLFEFVVKEGGPVHVVWQMLANLIPQYLSLGIPIGLMLGVLLAFRKLALSSELDSLRGVGLGYGRLLRVPYMYAIALAAVNLAIVGFVQPKAHYAYERLRFDLRSGALGAAIKVGEFNNLGPPDDAPGGAQRRRGPAPPRSLHPRRKPRRALARGDGGDGHFPCNRCARHDHPAASPADAWCTPRRSTRRREC